MMLPILHQILFSMAPSCAFQICYGLSTCRFHVPPPPRQYFWTGRLCTYGLTWLSFSQGNLGCPIHLTGCTKKIINQGEKGPLLWSAPARKWLAIPGHLQSPIKEKSDPPGHPWLELVVQSISPIDRISTNGKKLIIWMVPYMLVDMLDDPWHVSGYLGRSLAC